MRKCITCGKSILCSLPRHNGVRLTHARNRRRLRCAPATRLERSVGLDKQVRDELAMMLGMQGLTIFELGDLDAHIIEPPLANPES